MKHSSTRGADSASVVGGEAGGRAGAVTLTQHLSAPRRDDGVPAAALLGADDDRAPATADAAPALAAMFDFAGGGYGQAVTTAAQPVQLARAPGGGDDGDADAAAFDGAATGGGRALPYRAQMETAFGQDLGFVQAYTGAAGAMDALGAQAAARGTEVAFAETAPSPWLVAHELTHVVQQQQAGAPAVDRKATVAPADSAAEVEADRVADRVVAGEAAGPISAQPGHAIYRFAPTHHQGATVAGLASTFSAEEIGAIYASNWERDFSQGNPDIASAAIAWTAVKNHAAKHGGDPGSTAATFQAAVWKVVNGDLVDATDESLGTYKTWEHMDAPDDKKVRAAADKRWAGKANGVAGYIMDAKAHIKDQMVAAIDVYRLIHNHAAVGGSIDNWGGAAKPEGYVDPNVSKSGSTVTTHFPANYDDTTVASRAPIAEQAADRAKGAGAASDPAHDAARWASVAQHLGRAMHAFEDFWAHSNWLELAKLTYARATLGDSLPALLQGEAKNADLKTGTFAMPAKAHALGHKLLALATAFQTDFDLLLRVYGRAGASTKLDDQHAKTHRSTGWGGGGANDHELAYGALETDSYSTIGEISDVGTAVNNVEELVLSGKYKMEDFLCNRAWLAALAQKGQILIKQGDDNSDADSHGQIAKDQEEGDGHKDHAGAMVIARAANELAFGPLRKIMDEQDAAKALAATEKQLTLVDNMLQAPSASHPLWGYVAAAVKAD